CSSSLHVRQIGFFQDGVEYYRDELGYPVDEDDYVVDDMMHPHKKIAFIKVGVGGMYGRTYIHPCYKTEGAEETVRKAFSKDMIKKYFPAGIREEEKKK
ncbi:hypothetical protein KY348_04265, partial [Candidatus Woesearchaeota archaeon]|nr:hypothetical protein [Candidatus Woesearchaeota archaeon]